MIVFSDFCNASTGSPNIYKLKGQGLYPAELDQWCASATTALAEPQDARARPQATRQDRKRIKGLERELLRKDRALAETASLLVLSKKVAAIYNKGETA